jgi:L-galactose dehydrogenase
MYCEGQGVDIAKLAMQYTLENERIPTTLVSTASVQR